jgi:hypothetical protein
MSDVITLGNTPQEDYLQTLDYWIKYETFGIVDENYQEQSDYRKAQRFWAPIKLELLDMFTNKNKPEVLRFLNNLTLMCFYRNESDAYCVSLIVKDGGEQRPCYSHNFIDLVYDPKELMKKRIKITEYDGFQYDVYDELMDPNYCDATYDNARIDREFLLAYIKTTEWKALTPEDISIIFTRLFEYHSECLSSSIKF